MALTAGQISRDLFCFDLRRFLAACTPAGISPFADEDLTARAVAGAGLAALVVLPILLLSSVVLAAPLAVPAAIGVGYLAVSHAIAARNRRRAALFNGFVLCGLFGWLLLFMLVGEGPLSPVGLIAALMAPAVAAGPAVVRWLVAKRWKRPDSTLSRMRDTALERVAGLDELTPCEEVLVLDAEGAVLAATAAARKCLGLLPEAFEHHLNSLLEAGAWARMLNALDSCKARGMFVDGPTVDLDVAVEGRARRLTATLSLCSDGSFAMRIRERVNEKSGVGIGETIAAQQAMTRSAKPQARSVCDLGEALAFVLRHARPTAEAMHVALTSTVEPGLAALCDRQIGRRILHLLLDSALSSSAGGAVHIDARRLKGVVLLRAASRQGAEAGGSSAEANDGLDCTSLRTLVECAGGTLVFDRDGHDIALSVRLDLAPDRAASTQVEHRAEAV